MFTYKTSIHLRDTDATGVLYFGEQFRIALETFEHFLRQEAVSLQKILESGSFLLPIVHAEGDYALPLFVDDEIEVHLGVLRIGTSSFTLESRILKNRPLSKLALPEKIDDFEARHHGQRSWPDRNDEANLHKLAEELRGGWLQKGDFSGQMEFRKRSNGEQAGRVSIVHVSVDQKTRQKIPLPETVLTLLEALGPAAQAPHGSVLAR